jgi:hypothetical protein
MASLQLRLGVLAMITKTADRVGIGYLSAVGLERVRPGHTRVPSGQRTDGEAGLLPGGCMAGDQSCYLIRVNPAFHPDRMPGSLRRGQRPVPWASGLTSSGRGGWCRVGSPAWRAVGCGLWQRLADDHGATVAYPTLHNYVVRRSGRVN